MSKKADKAIEMAAHANALRAGEPESLAYQLAHASYMYDHWAKRCGPIASEYKRTIKELRHAMDA